MKSVKPFKTYQKLLVCAVPFLLLAAALLLNNIIDFDFRLYDCYIYKLLGIYCPGCGMTRSVIALLHGDFLLSVRENIMTSVGALLLLMLYIELVFRAFGKKIRTPAKNKYFLIGVLIFWGIYSVLRNFIPLIAPV